MFKIKIFSVGKTKEAWLQLALEEYTERLKSTMAFEWILAKTDEQLEDLLAKEHSFIALDPQGKQHTSEEFSSFLATQLETCGSRLTFAIGGAGGLSPQTKRRASQLLSLSRMTFTHQITRLILIEQIYRALEIQRGSGYHK